MGCLGAGHGIYVLILATFQAAVAFFLFARLQPLWEDFGPDEAGGMVPWMLDRPWAISLLALPAALAGICSIIRRRTSIVMILIETCLLVIPFAVMLIVFLLVFQQALTSAGAI